MSIVATLIFFICAFLWYFPLYKKRGHTDRMPGKFLILAILVGAIPVFIAIVGVQIPLGLGLNALKLPKTAHYFLDSFVSAALLEELVKFLCALVFVKIAKPKRGIDFALLFGSVGLGYEITESLAALDSPISALVRGVFAYHIVWQFWMGLYFWKFLQVERGKRFGPALAAFGVPIVLHGLNDFSCFMSEASLIGITDGAALTQAQEESAGTWFLFFLGVTVLCIVFNVITMIKCFREAKVSREADVKD